MRGQEDGEENHRQRVDAESGQGHQADGKGGEGLSGVLDHSGDGELDLIRVAPLTRMGPKRFCRRR